MVNGAMVIVPYEPENNKIVRRLLKDDIDLGMKDMRIRLVNASGDSGLGVQVADEMNLEGFNVVKVEDEHKTSKITEVVEHVSSPRVHPRLKTLFPDAKFRNSAEKSAGDYDITIILGADRAFVADRPAHEPVSATHWEQPQDYPTYRDNQPVPPPVSGPAAPAPAPPEPAPAAPAPAPVAPPPAPVAPPPAPVVAPPPAPAPVPDSAPAPAATPL